MAKKTTKTSKGFETGLLSFKRSLQISEALMFGTTKNDDGKITKTPVLVVEKGVRGQNSDSSGENAGKPNPQVIDAAFLPFGCSGLSIEFTVRVMPNAMTPHNSDDADTRKLYADLADRYAERGGFRELATLYAWNLANGRFAWRNAYQTDVSRVSVTFHGVEIAFDPQRLDLEELPTIEDLGKAVVEGDPAHVTDLVHQIERALGKKSTPLLISVIWTGEMETMQEVFPSQEYLLDDKAKKGKGRHYASVWVPSNGRQVRQASMHSQKIGAAIRFVDHWHGSSEHAVISVNPYGGVQETSDVLRHPKDGIAPDFFHIRKPNGPLYEFLSQDPAEPIAGDVHFFMANLVRGGVFSGKAGKNDSTQTPSEQGEPSSEDSAS